MSYLHFAVLYFGNDKPRNYQQILWASFDEHETELECERLEDNINEYLEDGQCQQLEGCFICPEYVRLSLQDVELGKKLQQNKQNVWARICRVSRGTDALREFDHCQDPLFDHEPTKEECNQVDTRCREIYKMYQLKNTSKRYKRSNQPQDNDVNAYYQD
jgi:hypothetical protein